MTQAPAGWYADPEQPGRLRWWTGAAWSPHVHEAARPAPAVDVVPTRTQPRSRSTLRVGLLVLAIGVAAGIVGLVGALRPVFQTVLTGSLETPVATTLDLDEGHYIVYEWTGTARGGGGFTFTNNGAMTLTVESAAVTGPSGERVPVRLATRGSQTITQGTRIYSDALAFDAPRTGSYTVVIESIAPGRVVIARSLGDTFRRAVPMILLAVGGFLALVAGAVLLVIHTVRRAA